MLTLVVSALADICRQPFWAVHKCFGCYFVRGIQKFLLSKNWQNLILQKKNVKINAKFSVLRTEILENFCKFSLISCKVAEISKVFAILRQKHVIVCV